MPSRSARRERICRDSTTDPFPRMNITFHKGMAIRKVVEAAFLCVLTGVMAVAESRSPTARDRLSLKLEIDTASASLAAGVPASLTVTNISQDIVQCDLWQIENGGVLTIQEVPDSSHKSEAAAVMGSRRYIPTAIRPGESVKITFSLLKLMPKLGEGTRELRFTASISVIPVTEKGEVIGGGRVEVHEGNIRVVIKP